MPKTAMNQDLLHEFAHALQHWMPEAARPHGYGAVKPDEAPPGARDEHFSQMALRLHRLQCQSVPILRAVSVASSALHSAAPTAGGEATPGARWTDIPALPIRFFKESDDISSIPLEDRTRVFHSSGTTGRARSRHHHHAASLHLYEASARHWFEVSISHLRGEEAFEFQPISLTPHPREAPNSSLVHMFGALFTGPTASLSCPLTGNPRSRGEAEPTVFCGELSRDGDWLVNLETLLRLATRAQKDRRPVLLCGTAFSFVHVLDAIAGKSESTRLALPEGSAILETGGYKGRSRELSKPELHRALGEAFGVSGDRIFCEYGMSELSSQAYDVPLQARVTPPSADAANLPGATTGQRTRSNHGSPSLRLPPWARFRILSPETGRECSVGETGILVVYDLANVWSCMAVETEDLAVATGDGGFRLVGRVDQAEARGCSLMTVDQRAQGSDHDRMLVKPATADPGGQTLISGGALPHARPPGA